MDVEEVATIITEAEAGKPLGADHVDLSVEVLDLDEQETAEEICASSDANSSVELLEKSIDEVVIDEASPAKAKAVEEKDASKDSADGADGHTLRKRKSVEKEDMLEGGMEVMSIEEYPSSVKKIREKSGSDFFILKLS